ncbi:carboxyl-terminal processing protease [Balneicella halophila]|uniref:Carboxyl-terminal processing protease n=1 Tax=Balneicella halophila TaxID=1537566 RepID=A0A7L4USU7_BALHA|nr:S41 family peptidase [Balneicella halophila]PVX52094.1 carboxyl-terminal processing protease [Balneicella halophila]
MNTKTKIWLPLIIAIAILGGYALHYFTASPRKNYMVFPQKDEVSGKLNAILQRLDNSYYKPLAIDSIEEAVINDMLKGLDPHTAYISAEYMQQVREDMQGHFSGIGVQFIEYEDTVMVVRPIPGGPSERVGIMAGDRIVTVDGDTIAGRQDVSTDSIMKLLKGKAGTLVDLGIKKPTSDELKVVQVTRGDVNVSTIDVAYMLDEQTGYIKINQFGGQTYNEFLAALSELKDQHADRFIIDLRGNAGGLLDVCVGMVNEFLDKNDLIVYTKGYNTSRLDRRANGKGNFKDVPLVILIDSYSASASEIFAGAIQDHDRGIVVGRRSFGKGLVQEQVEYGDGSALRLTVAEYFTPSGRNIQKPFKMGDRDAYDQDLNDRWEHGEFAIADSIQFVDSLKYETDNGRTVYGGGGIMPDVFVPLDTTAYSTYFEELQRKAVVRDFAYYFTDHHRAELAALANYKAMAEYIENQNYMEQFVDYAVKKGVAKDAKGYEVSKKILANSVKALIVRNMIDNEGFYPIYHQNDEILKAGLKAFDKEYKELTTQLR